VSSNLIFCHNCNVANSSPRPAQLMRRKFRIGAPASARLRGDLPLQCRDCRLAVPSSLLTLETAMCRRSHSAWGLEI